MAGDATDERQVAQQCLDDWGTLERRMNQEGFWLTGWRSGAAMGPSAPGAGWANAPRHELRALRTAAVVLARRGDEQAYQAVLGELAEMYDRYAGELRAAGVESGRIADRRFNQLAAAKPAVELGPRVRLDDVTGTNVRNRADEDLVVSVDEVLLDPQGDISYAVVATGGFLGLGQTHVAVPWERLQAPPRLNTFVLDVGEDVMAAAPEVNLAALGDPEVYQQWRQETDRFWQQHAGRSRPPAASARAPTYRLLRPTMRPVAAALARLALAAALLWAGGGLGPSPARAQMGQVPPPSPPEVTEDAPVETLGAGSRSEELGRSGGVIAPPDPDVDPGLVWPPPDEGAATTPVIPPPASPRGDPNVRPL